MPAAICFAYFYAQQHKWWWISFCARESPWGWGLVRAGEVCTVWELIWYWIDKREEARVFSIYNPMLCEEAKRNPSQASMIGFAKWNVILQQMLEAQHLTLAVPSFLNWPTWWFDESYFLRCLTMSIYFCLCLCVFWSQSSNIITWYQCWIKSCPIEPLSLNVAEPEVHVCVI